MTHNDQPEEVALRDSLILVEALYEIVMESDDSEIVRRAVGALTSTEAGRRYLQTHPIII